MDSNSTQHSKQASKGHGPIAKRYRDPNNKKRPCNHYTLFFILERELFLQSRGAVTPMSRSQTNPNGDYLGLNIPRLPPRYASLVLPDDWYDHSNARGKNRKHRNSHGLINFIELTKMVAANWKNPDNESAKFVMIVAEQVKEREMQLQLQEQKEREEENCFTDVLAVKSANKISRTEKTQRAGPSHSQQNVLSPKCEKKTTALPSTNDVFCIVQQAPGPTDTNNMNVTSRQLHHGGLPRTQSPHRKPCHLNVRRLMYAEKLAIRRVEAEIMTIRHKELEIRHVMREIAHMKAVRRKEIECQHAMRDIARMQALNSEMMHCLRTAPTAIMNRASSMRNEHNPNYFFERVNFDANRTPTTITAVNNHVDRNYDINGRFDSRQQHIQPDEIHSRAPPPKTLKIDDLKEARSIYQETTNRRHVNLEPSEIRSSMPYNSSDDVDAQAEKEADEFLSRVYGVRGEEALNKIKRAMF